MKTTLSSRATVLAAAAGLVLAAGCNGSDNMKATSAGSNSGAVMATNLNSSPASASSPNSVANPSSPLNQGSTTSPMPHPTNSSFGNDASAGGTGTNSGGTNLSPGTNSTNNQ